MMAPRARVRARTARMGQRNRRGSKPAVRRADRATECTSSVVPISSDRTAIESPIKRQRELPQSERPYGCVRFANHKPSCPPVLLKQPSQLTPFGEVSGAHRGQYDYPERDFRTVYARVRECL